MIYGFLIGLMAWAYRTSTNEQTLREKKRLYGGEIKFYPVTLITTAILWSGTGALVGALIESLR